MKRKFIAVFSALTMGISMFSATLTASSLTLVDQPADTFSKPVLKLLQGTLTAMENLK